MIQLDKEKLDGSIGLLTSAFNGNVLESFASLAQVLKEEQASVNNEVVNQAYEQCKKVQGIYNDCLESLKGFFQDVNEVIDIAEYLEKQADMGSVGSHDATFANQGIDASEVRI